MKFLKFFEGYVCCAFKVGSECKFGMEVQVRKFGDGSWKFLGNSGWEECWFKMGSSELGNFNVSNLGWEFRVVGNWGWKFGVESSGVRFF